MGGGEHNITMNIKQTRHADLDWIRVTRDRVQWQALVIMVKALEFHKRREIS
jgi:hypothetical protein